MQALRLTLLQDHHNSFHPTISPLTVVSSVPSTNLIATVKDLVPNDSFKHDPPVGDSAPTLLSMKRERG